MEIHILNFGKILRCSLLLDKNILGLFQKYVQVIRSICLGIEHIIVFKIKINLGLFQKYVKVIWSKCLGIGNIIIHCVTKY